MRSGCQSLLTDALPFDNRDNPLCSTSEFFPDYAWPALIEKALREVAWQLGGSQWWRPTWRRPMADLTGGMCLALGSISPSGMSDLRGPLLPGIMKQRHGTHRVTCHLARCDKGVFSMRFRVWCQKVQVWVFTCGCHFEIGSGKQCPHSEKQQHQPGPYTLQQKTLQSDIRLETVQYLQIRKIDSKHIQMLIIMRLIGEERKQRT